MWNLFGRGKSGADAGKSAIDSVLRSLDESDASRPLPTLVCRTCGLKYENLGTYLKGSRCPTCFPER
jgi:predicted Zn-ribbon and HTH transcriptional regulator